MIGNHFLASCKLTLKRPKSVPPTITTRSFKNFNTEAFCKDISETPLDTVSIFNYIDDQVSSFNKLFLDILDQHAPIREIRELISKRVSLKYACMTINPTDWEANRILRQKVKSNIRATEFKHVKEEIATNLSNKSSIWKFVRRCLNSHGSSNLQYSRETLEVVNTFN